MLAMRRSSPWILLALLAVGCDRDTPLDPVADFRSSSSSGPAPSAPSSASAVAASHNQINISWHDNSTNETGFELYRSTSGVSGAFSLLASTGANTTSYSDVGLTASTEYCYKVRAFRRYDGKTSYSSFSIGTCAATPAAPIPAAAPSGVRAAFDLAGGIAITWVDNSADETGFRVERSVASGSWTALGSAAANVVRFRDEYPPSVEQSACYRIFAFNGLGDSPGSNVACTAWPRAPSNLAATVTGSDVDLTWSDNSAVEDGFEVLRWPDGWGESVIATLPANTSTYHDPGLADGVYWYQVRVTKDGRHGGQTGNVWVLVVSSPPVTPSGVEARPSGSTVAFVSWRPSQTNEAGFRVERSTDGGASWTVAVVRGMRSSGFDDAAQPSEQLLCYRVTAFNAVGESPPSPTDCTALPLGPTNLVATAADGPAVDLSWSDHSALEDGYTVLRLFAFCGVDDDGFNYCYSNYEPIAFLGPNVTSYRDLSVSAGTSLSYFVIAVKDGGQSDWSNEAIATVP